MTEEMKNAAGAQEATPVAEAAKAAFFISSVILCQFPY